MRKNVFFALVAMMSMLFAGCNKEELTPDSYPSKSGTVITSSGEWNWSYNAEDRTLTISGTGEMTPDQYDYPWKYNKDDHTFCLAFHHIVIKNGITVIGEKAFNECYRVETVTLPNSLKTIKEGAFMSCTMKSITIPNSVTTIEKEAFYHCYELTQITLSNQLKEISYRMLSSCNNLTSLTIPASVKKIDSHFVAYSESLKTVVCKPTTPPTITTYTFDDSKIKTVKVPQSSVNTYKNDEDWKIKVIRDKKISIEAE